jgi:1,3-beta-glucan synthase
MLGSYLRSIIDSDDGYAQSDNSHMSVTTRPGPTNYDPYPAWSADKQIPISYEEIEDIFLDLTQKFGFQRDSMRNQVRYVKKCLSLC